MNGDLHLQFKFYAEEVILNYAVRKVFGFLLLSKPTECLNFTFRGSKRRLLVYFEDFDHPTETQMLHTPLLLGALAIFVYRIMSSQCSKASKATEFPFESYGCDAKLSGGAAEEIASFVVRLFFFKVLWSQAL